MVGAVSQNYVPAIQDALGNDGAALRIDSRMGNNTTTLTGAPTGLAEATSTGVSRLADIVTLSPQAQAQLANARVALAVISGASARASYGPGAMTGVANQNTASPATPNAGQANGSASKFSAGPSANVAGTSQMIPSDPNTYYDFLSSQNQLDATLSAMGSDEEKASFLAAFNSRRLKIQNTSDIPGFNLSTTTVLTGTSETMFAGSYNSQAEKAAQDQGGGYALLLLNPLGESQLVTWGPGPPTTVG